MQDYADENCKERRKCRLACKPFLFLCDKWFWCMGKLTGNFADKACNLLCYVFAFIIILFLIVEWAVALQLRQVGMEPPKTYISYGMDSTREIISDAMRSVADFLHD